MLDNFFVDDSGEREALENGEEHFIHWIIVRVDDLNTMKLLLVR